MTREELIEEAAKAMAERAPDGAWEDCNREWYLADARVAFAVFEKAQAPTDHVKEAIYGGAEFVCVTCPRNIYGENVAWDQAHPAQTDPTDAQVLAADALAEYDRGQPSDYERAYADPLAEALRALLSRPVQDKGYHVELGDQRFTQAQWEAVQRYCEGRPAQTEPTDAQRASARKAIHRALAPNWMSVVGALGGDQAEYEAMLDTIADAVLTAVQGEQS